MAHRQRDSRWHLTQRNPFDLSLGDEARHIKAYDVVLVEVLLKARIMRNLLVRKELARIAAYVVISAQHLSGIGLSEAARHTDAGKLLASANRLVDQADQARLVHIPSARLFGEPAVSRIKACAHVAPPRDFHKRVFTMACTVTHAVCHGSHSPRTGVLAQLYS